MPWFLAAHLFSWYLGTCLHGQNEVTIYPQRTLLSQWLVWIYPQRAHWASLTSKGWLSSTSEVVPLAATLCSCAVSPKRTNPSASVWYRWLFRFRRLSEEVKQCLCRCCYQMLVPQSALLPGFSFFRKFYWKICHLCGTKEGRMWVYLQQGINIWR